MADDSYVNIRHPEILGKLLGQRLVDITQQDEDEYPESGAYVQFFFENGTIVRFPITDDGFVINEG